MCLERQIHVRLSAILQLIAIKWRYIHTHTYGNKHMCTRVYFMYLNLYLIGILTENCKIVNAFVK